MEKNLALGLMEKNIKYLRSLVTLYRHKGQNFEAAQREEEIEGLEKRLDKLTHEYYRENGEWL